MPMPGELEVTVDGHPPLITLPPSGLYQHGVLARICACADLIGRMTRASEIRE